VLAQEEAEEGVTRVLVANRHHVLQHLLHRLPNVRTTSQCPHTYTSVYELICVLILLLVYMCGWDLAEEELPEDAHDARRSMRTHISSYLAEEALPEDAHDARRLLRRRSLCVRAVTQRHRRLQVGNTGPLH
jgi:hypothetical protein